MSKLFQELHAHKISVLCDGMIFVSALTLIVGFVVPLATITAWFHASGYYFIFGTFLFWLFTLLPEHPDIRCAWSFGRRHGLAAGLAIVLIIGAELTSPPKFRVLADETNLVGMSAAMYDARAFYNPIEGKQYFYAFDTLTQEWNVRPLFFPFLISLAHTLFGYSGYNGFVVNACAGGGLLFVFYLLLQRWFGRFLALNAMVWLAAFPALILCITSTGFEVLNILFMLLAFLWLDMFLATQASRDVERLGLTLILLAQIRYESVLFIGCLLPVALAVMRRRHYAALPYRVLALPLLLLPVLWQRRIFALNAAVYYAEPGETLLSFKAFGRHLHPAWNFFTAQPDNCGTIPVLFYGALLGAGYGIIWYIRRRKSMSARTTGMILAVSLSGLLQGSIVLAFFEGDLMLPSNMRYGIFFLPFLVLLSVTLLRGLLGAALPSRRFICVGSLALLLFYWPVAGKNDSIRQLFFYREYRLALDFLEQQYPDRNILIVSDRPGMFTPHRWGALSFPYANANALNLQDELERHLFQAIIVLQRIKYADQQPEQGTALDIRFRLETLFEAQLTAETFVRFSRVLPRGTNERVNSVKIA